MKTNFFAFASLLAILSLIAMPASAQTNNFTATTLSSAMTSTDQAACLTSATGVVQSGFGAAGSFLLIGTEQMQVQTVSSYSATCFNVARLSKPIAHASGDGAYVGAGNWFQRIDPPAGVGGTCTLASLAVHPWINAQSGQAFVCSASKWQNIASVSGRCTTEFDAVTGTTGTTLTNVVGMSVTVVPGTYRFEVKLPGVATANTGQKYAFKLTTAVLGSIESTGRAYTASGVALTHTTTTTDQTLLMDSASGVVLDTVIEGIVVVTTGGTITLQSAQHTAHVDTTSVYVGATMTFNRI